MRALDVPAVGVNVVAGDSDGSGGVALAVAFAITSIPICVTCLKPRMQPTYVRTYVHIYVRVHVHIHTVSRLNS